MKKIFLLLVLFLPHISSAQMRPRSSDPLMIPTERFLYDVSSLPSEISGKSKIQVAVQAPYDMLVFTKSPERTTKDFIGSFDITIEIFDKDKNSTDRKIKQEILELTYEEKKLLKDKFYKAVFTFNVKPGDYNLIIEFNDKESNNSIRRELKTFKAKDYQKNNISDILFFPSPADTGVPINFSGNIPYGENCVLSAFLSGFDREKDNLNIKLFKFEERKRDTVFSIRAAKEFITTKYPDKTGGLSVSEIKIPMKTDTFEIARYEIILESKSGATLSESKKMFEIQWYKMPFSLRDFYTAQKFLKLITNEEEFDQLQSGSKTVQRDKFLDFWKKRDPTPKTVYNELMTEFYKRVDYSIINFSSVASPDGSFTDRGKTYILNGKPDSSDRKLLPGEAPFEIWTYGKLGKKYIFIDESRQGEYKLSAVEKL